MLSALKPNTREDGLAQLIAIADKLNETDPIEAAILLKLADRMLRASQAKPRRSEYELGQLTGAEDLHRKRPAMSRTLMSQVHTEDFIRGYETGYKGTAP